MHPTPQVFIDPPEFITQPGKMYNRDLDGDGLPDVEAWPDKNGRIVLRVKYRGDTIQWYKNEIALKEGADGGRISGVASDTLVFSQLLGRDRNQKLWAVAKNKWGASRAILAQFCAILRNSLTASPSPLQAPSRRAR